MFLHGHTHAPQVEKKDGVIIINPGHLTTQNTRGYPPTIAKIWITGQDIRVAVSELKTETVMIEQKFRKNET